MKDLLRTADLERDELVHLLELAEAFKRHPHLHADALRGQIVVLSFAPPSVAIRLAFEAAVARLGGAAATVGPNDLALERGDDLRDAGQVVSGCAAAMVVGTAVGGKVLELARHASVPVVNGGTDGHDPVQSLADMLTIREHFHHFADRKLAYVGAGTNVAHSLLEAAATLGMDVSVATPPSSAPAVEVVQGARVLAEESGSVVEVTTDPVVAVKGADVVSTGDWPLTGDSEAERSDRRSALDAYRVTPELLAEAAPGALFMHRLPAHRGDEVAAEVVDGPQSVVSEQAANRVPSAQAVLYALIKGDFHGGRSWS